MKWLYRVEGFEFNPLTVAMEVFFWKKKSRYAMLSQNLNIYFFVSPVFPWTRKASWKEFGLKYIKFWQGHSYQLWDIRFQIAHFLNRKYVILVLSIRWSNLFKCVIFGRLLSNSVAIYWVIQEFLLSQLYSCLKYIYNN